MDRVVYDRMAAHDSTHWWYRARRDILRDYLRRYVEEAPVGHIRHDLSKCFELHRRLQETGSMLG